MINSISSRQTAVLASASTSTSDKEKVASNIVSRIDNVRPISFSSLEGESLLSKASRSDYKSINPDKNLHDNIIISVNNIHTNSQVNINDTHMTPGSLLSHQSAPQSASSLIIDIDDNSDTSSDSGGISESVSINIGQASTADSDEGIEGDRSSLVGSSLYTTLEQTVKNLGLSVSRNLFSVGIPTAAREYVRRGITPNISPTALKGMGAVACGLPIALELIGLARECYNNSYTKESIAARVANIFTVSAASAGLVVSGNFMAAAPALIAAVFCYVPMRDAIQYFVQLSDNNSSGINGSATLGASAGYVANQTAVDQLMTIVSDALTPYMDSVAANVLGRAIVNIAGESTDDMTNAGFNAIAKKNDDLQFSLAFRSKENMTLESVLDQVFTTLAGRASLFTTAFAVAYAVPLSGILASAAVGLTLGLGYIPFIYSHAQKNTPQSDDQQIEAMERGEVVSPVPSRDSGTAIEAIIEMDTAFANV